MRICWKIGLSLLIVMAYVHHSDAQAPAPARVQNTWLWPTSCFSNDHITALGILFEMMEKEIQNEPRENNRARNKNKMQKYV